MPKRKTVKCPDNFDETGFVDTTGLQNAVKSLTEKVLANFPEPMGSGSSSKAAIPVPMGKAKKITATTDYALYMGGAIARRKRLLTTLEKMVVELVELGVATKICRQHAMPSAPAGPKPRRRGGRGRK